MYRCCKFCIEGLMEDDFDFVILVIPMYCIICLALSCLAAALLFGKKAKDVHHPYTSTPTEISGREDDLDDRVVGTRDIEEVHANPVADESDGRTDTSIVEFIETSIDSLKSELRRERREPDYQFDGRMTTRSESGLPMGLTNHYNALLTVMKWLSNGENTTGVLTTI